MSYQTKLEQLEQKKAALQKSSPARDRLVALFDEETFVELDAFAACGEEGVGVITGYGSVEGDVVYAFFPGRDHLRRRRFQSARRKDRKALRVGREERIPSRCDL